MRGTDRFENVIDLVREISANHYDETIPVVDMEFDSLKRMWVSGKKMEVLPSAQRLMANRLRVPYSYLIRCPEDLQAQNLNHWLREETKQRDNLFCRFDGNSLRAVFTDRYTALDHLEILSKMMGYGIAPEAEVQYALDQGMLVVKIPDYTRTFGLNGDRITPGISIANSEVGILAFSIEAYFYRLVCSNGLIAQTAVSSKFRHISRKGLDEFPDIMRQVVFEIENNQGKFRLSLASPVSAPLSSIELFNRQFQIGKEAGEAVKIGYEREPGFTMFHVINAYTRAAQAYGLSTEECYHLEKVGGLILSMVKK
ncbi:MAG: DUF932 domain-containing protein [Deltaproteobacteria bacterium]|nr:DUF932 domain-containing protein [Deltaproteobacteria bacterium]